MSESNLTGALLQSQVSVEQLPASRQIVAVERQTDGTWRVCGSGQSDTTGQAEIAIQARPTSLIYAVAVDEWGMPWSANMTVAAGDTVRPPQFSGWLYRVTQSGQLPADEPAWWTGSSVGPRPVGTARLEAVRYYQPIAHGPLSLEFELSSDVYGEIIKSHYPLAYWRLDETTGLVMADASGNGRDGKYTSSLSIGRPPLVAGNIAGHSIYTDGRIGDQAFCDPAPWMNTTHVSVGAVVKPSDGFLGGNRTVASKFGDSADSDSWIMRIESGRPTFYVKVNSVWNAAKSSESLVLSEPAVLVGTHDGLAVRIYVNGVLMGSIAAPGGVSFSNSAVRLAQGGTSANTSNDERWRGYIDEVALYGYALAEEQVAEQYSGFLA